MDTTFDFGTKADREIVYVRSVKVDELPKDIRDQAGDIETLYAVHNSDGDRLALVKDRNMAFILARQNDLIPFTAH